MVHQQHRQPRHTRGFTLIELVVVVAVIAILAALLVPTILGQAQRARISSETASIHEIGKALQRFKTDTGEWPVGAGTWPSLLANVGPTDFAAGSDIALETMPAGKVPCKSVQPGELCWGGPYLTDTTKGLSGPDAWGNPRRFAYLAPELAGGGGDGAPTAPGGAIVVWSRGPDGIDQTACGDANSGCSFDISKLGLGKPTVDGADDVIYFVSAAR